MANKQHDRHEISSVCGKKVAQSWQKVLGVWQTGGTIVAKCVWCVANRWQNRGESCLERGKQVAQLSRGAWCEGVLPDGPHR